MEQTRNEDDARREKQEMKHRRREGSKNKDIITSRKIDHRIFWAKNWYGDDEKHGKGEVWKEKWGKTKRRYTKTAVEKKDKETWDTEKKRRRNTEMEK